MAAFTEKKTENKCSKTESSKATLVQNIAIYPLLFTQNSGFFFGIIRAFIEALDNWLLTNDVFFLTGAPRQHNCIPLISDQQVDMTDINHITRPFLSDVMFYSNINIPNKPALQ